MTSTDTIEQDDSRGLWVTDAELIRRSGVPLAENRKST